MVLRPFFDVVTSSGDGGACRCAVGRAALHSPAQFHRGASRDAHWSEDRWSPPTVGRLLDSQHSDEAVPLGSELAGVGVAYGRWLVAIALVERTAGSGVCVRSIAARDAPSGAFLVRGIVNNGVHPRSVRRMCALGFSHHMGTYLRPLLQMTVHTVAMLRAFGTLEFFKHDDQTLHTLLGGKLTFVGAIDALSLVVLARLDSRHGIVTGDRNPWCTHPDYFDVPVSGDAVVVHSGENAEAGDVDEPEFRRWLHEHVGDVSASTLPASETSS